MSTARHGPVPWGNRQRNALAGAAVLILAAAVWIAWPYLQGTPGPAAELTLACVASGEIFTLAVNEVGMIPGRNPRTGAYTLLPCKRGADDVVRIVERYRPALTNQLSALNRVVDPQTFVVKVRP